MRYERVVEDSEERVREDSLIEVNEKEVRVTTTETRAPERFLLVAKPKSRTEDFLDALTEAFWYCKKLIDIRVRIKNLLLSLGSVPPNKIPLIQEMIKEAEKEERRIARAFYNARKKTRTLCEYKYSSENACEKCKYYIICWGRIRVR